MEKYTVIDLFAGAGGLSYGFQQTGKFRLVAAAEINVNAQATYKANIADGVPGFVFIDNVIGYNFSKLSDELGGIDIVIGGPPCQGFSNANRQKNHLISMNNSLVKEYFRAIKEIRPLAFVMENVSMLRSDTHRFYESHKDNAEIDALIESGHSIPKRFDSVLVANCRFAGIDYEQIEFLDIDTLSLPADLKQLLSVLNKNKSNPRRLPNYLAKHRAEIITQIDAYIAQIENPNAAQQHTLQYLRIVRNAVDVNNVGLCIDVLDEIVKVQKMLSTIREIQQNELIGTYRTTEAGALYFDVRSYSVIDYINAILGDEYVQDGCTVNAEWYGVPQERRRYIVIGVRKDIFKKEKLSMPVAPENITLLTVGDAISDLQSYDACYEPKHTEMPYHCDDQLSAYATSMRLNSTGVNNHITTKTTDVAMKRFQAIQQGKNFHSLDTSLKDTYSKPERTQNTIYLRLDPTKPSGTVVNVRKSMWIHPELDRAITVREAARLQSFPDRFIFEGSKDSQYQQVGNAVPPLLAEGIAYKVLDNLE